MDFSQERTYFKHQYRKTAPLEFKIIYFGVYCQIGLHML